jgi:hypothetical protein
MDRNAFGTFPAHTRAISTSSVGPMKEARAVLRRLRRIEALERERAPARSILSEVHALLEEAEAWLAVEPGGSDLAEAALERCRDALAAPVVR